VNVCMWSIEPELGFEQPPIRRNFDDYYSAADLYLYLIIPKGLLPQQDTGEILGITEAAQNTSFSAMLERQRALSDIIRLDPDVQTIAAFVGTSTVNATLNTGRLYIVLKPRAHHRASADQIIARLRRSTANLPGLSLFMQPAQDLQIDSRVTQTQYQYVLQDTNSDELNRWVSKFLSELRSHSEFIDLRTDQQLQGQQVYVQIDRQKASRLGVQIDAIDNVLYDCFGQ
jgi:multidrug efflux pump